MVCLLACSRALSLTEGALLPGPRDTLPLWPWLMTSMGPVLGSWVQGPAHPARVPGDCGLVDSLLHVQLVAAICPGFHALLGSLGVMPVSLSTEFPDGAKNEKTTNFHS